MMKYYIMLFFTLALAGCITWVTPPPNECQRMNATTLIMSGPVDEEMMSCANVELDEKIETLIVSSFGGNTKIGRAIGTKIAERPRTLVVRGACLSSCANYFVPTSDKLIVERDSFIGLHGTIDPYTIIKNGFELDAYESELDAEQKFAAQYNVPRGWRLYRDKGWSGGIITNDMLGKPRPPTHKNTDAMYLVERAFLTSCLPHVDIVEDEFDESAITNPALRKKINALGLIGTGSLICKPNTGQKDDTP